ncbi:MAG: M20 family peptidase [Candidatus Viridilinea halotolerans]|uniref:M20 family peptidase n=1 Tax=Candidatus Viridilinea halotolerans TaxID=2491704 RepID=A0A426U1J3_9CHLR|nr:MAG: M20 family peptidase [Candidatus Viridilinea halotolerans]
MSHAYIASQRDELLALARVLVECESPSLDKVRCDALADRLATYLAPLGKLERVANPTGGDHLCLRVPAPYAPAEARPALLLCHYDTVWPAGVLAARPVRVEGNTIFGPGIYDMKASIAMVTVALRAVQALQLQLPRPINVLITSDEEIGSPTSRELIEAEARHAAHVLVLEPPVEQGHLLKTARKGVGLFKLAITGRAAHAGVEPEKGVNALIELAHQMLAISQLADASQGTSVSVSFAQGGSNSFNVIPATAHCVADVRVWSRAEAERLEAAFASLQPVLPGATLSVSGGFNRPPMEAIPVSRELYARVQALGAELGLTLGEGATGGASDGNFTAVLGIATLDGLGAPGQGAHALHEQIDLAATVERTELLLALLSRL